MQTLQPPSSATRLPASSKPVVEDWIIRLFGSRAPLGFEAGDANLYRYVGNNPTNATDPSGLLRITIRGVTYTSIGGVLVAGGYVAVNLAGRAAVTGSIRTEIVTWRGDHGQETHGTFDWTRGSPRTLAWEGGRIDVDRFIGANTARLTDLGFEDISFRNLRAVINFTSPRGIYAYRASFLITVDATAPGGGAVTEELRIGSFWGEMTQ